MKGQAGAEAGVFLNKKEHVSGLLIVLGIVFMILTYFAQYNPIYYIWTVLGIICLIIGIYLLVKK